MGGALIELALREFRDGELDEKSIMAQVRSSKYHKRTRVAAVIQQVYE